MNLRAKIAVAAGLLLLAGCRELQRYFAGDTTIARAGGKDLRLGDVRSVVPQGLSGDDSAAFMKVYIDRWVLKQLKLQEAETLFSSSAGDIDKMVEEYRQALLIRQLDQHYVDRSIDTVFTADEIAAYYNAHKADFKLDRTIVKGRIVRFGEGYRQAAKLKTLMGARSEAQQQDFRDICEKNDFTVDDFRDQWIDFPEFLSYLPTLRSQSYDSVLATAAVQEMRDSHAHYYFQIDAVLREGEPIPLERLRGTIRRILFNQRKGEIIRAHEEELCARAAAIVERAHVPGHAQPCRFLQRHPGQQPLAHDDVHAVDRAREPLRLEWKGEKALLPVFVRQRGRRRQRAAELGIIVSFQFVHVLHLSCWVSQPMCRRRKICVLYKAAGRGII